MLEPQPHLFGEEDQPESSQHHSQPASLTEKAPNSAGPSVSLLLVTSHPHSEGSLTVSPLCVIPGPRTGGMCENTVPGLQR